MVSNILLKPSVQFSNISATTAAFTLGGGLYGVSVSATFGGGNVVLQRLGADGTTYLPVMTALTAAGYTTAYLPAGSYKLAITTATAVYADISQIEI
jgi:hypothetical protein